MKCTNVGSVGSVLLFSLLLMTCSRNSDRIIGGRGREPAGLVDKEIRSPAAENSGPQQPVTLSDQEIQLAVKKLVPTGVVLIPLRGSWVFAAENIDDNAPAEYLAIGAVSSRSGTSLKDSAYLYSGELSPAPFYLYLFQQHKDSLVLSATHFLGKRLVYSAYKRLQLKADAPFPLALGIVFAVPEGTEHEYLIFGGREVQNISRLSLAKSAALDFFLRDIDSDGIVDVVVLEISALEGTGFETYLTWLTWNGSRFTEKATSNLVQNLGNFLKRTRSLFLAHKWTEFLEYCLKKETVARYLALGYSPQSIILKALKLEKAYNLEKNTPDQILKNINSLVFPEILENPFNLEAGFNTCFLLTFGVEDSNGVPQVAEIKLFLNENPFASQQYYFYLAEPE